MSHLAVGILVAAAATNACAQAYPVKPIRLVVATAPGGGSDFVGRLVGAKLTEALGQQIVVENRPGAGSTLGYEFVLRSPPDGYTLAVITPSYSINPSLYPLKFDATSDYTPIGPIARGPYVLVVHPSLPVKNVRDLIALAKARPNQLVYGSSGNGAIVHLTTAHFLHMARISMVHVPYKGGGPALTDVIAGQIQVVFATSQTGLPQAKAGRLRVLGVTTPYRIAAEPDLPTIAEAGVPGYEVTNWHALIGPKGLPRAVVEKLNGELNRFLKAKEMDERFQNDGMSPAPGTPDQLAEQIRKEIDLWRQVVQRAGVKLN